MHELSVSLPSDYKIQNNQIKMKINRLEITTFRHLNNLNFDFGSILTVIAGGNGTGKTSMLGIIGHIFKFSNLYYNLFNGRFETKYSAVTVNIEPKSKFRLFRCLKVVISSLFIFILI